MPFERLILISIFRFKPKLADGHTSAFFGEGREGAIQANRVEFHLISLLSLCQQFSWYVSYCYYRLFCIRMIFSLFMFSIQYSVSNIHNWPPLHLYISFKFCLLITFFRNGTRHPIRGYNLSMAYTHTQLLLENNTIVSLLKMGTEKEWERDQELKFVFYSDWLSWIHFRWGQPKTIHDVYVILQWRTLEKCGLSSDIEKQGNQHNTQRNWTTKLKMFLTAKNPNSKLSSYIMLTKPTSFDVFENQTTSAYSEARGAFTTIEYTISYIDAYLKMDSRFSFSSYEMVNECHYKFSLAVCIQWLYIAMHNRIYTFAKHSPDLRTVEWTIKVVNTNGCVCLCLAWNRMEFECLVFGLDIPRYSTIFDSNHRNIYTSISAHQMPNVKLSVFPGSICISLYLRLYRPKQVLTEFKCT